MLLSLEITLVQNLRGEEDFLMTPMPWKKKAVTQIKSTMDLQVHILITYSISLLILHLSYHYMASHFYVCNKKHYSFLLSVFLEKTVTPQTLLPWSCRSRNFSTWSSSKMLFRGETDVIVSIPVDVTVNFA